MPIYQTRRHLRKVLDACVDMSGTEQVNSSQNTQWTDHYANYWTNQGLNSTSDYFYFYTEWMDSNGDFPHQDQVIVSSFGGQPVALVNGSALQDTGFKHLQHQAQCMKGKAGTTLYGPLQGGSPANAMAGDHLSFFAPSFSNVEAVHDGAGTFKHQNIKLGGFRGLQYSQQDNPIWTTGDNSDNFNLGERLNRTGAVSVGDAA